MNKKKLFIKARYQNMSYARQYCFLTDIPDIQSGDILVADSSNGLGLVFAVDYTENPTETRLVTHWIACKVDMEALAAKKLLT